MVVVVVVVVDIASARMPEASSWVSHSYRDQAGQGSAARLDHMGEVQVQRATVHLAWLLEHRGGLYDTVQLVEELLPKIG